MEFQEKLKKLRQEKGLSQAALAKNIYVSRSAIAKWESGLGAPSASNLQALCTFFGVEEEWLMSRNDLKQQVGLTRSRTKILILALLAIAVPVTGILLGHCITFTARRSVSMYYPPLSLFGYIATYHRALYGFLCFSALLWVGTIAFSVLTIAIRTLQIHTRLCLWGNAAGLAVCTITFLIIFSLAASAADPVYTICLL